MQKSSEVNTLLFCEKDFEFRTVACLCWPSCLFASSGKSCSLLSPGT
ncbi:uncharacterized protein DS421_16g533710 [Arachis hypogaea]|nr:uncharacterized protein DS421_16g533710 [Arachis hypogaea]QHN85022.1 uncharacterized protein DS421_16g533710 [Arachis hypogaea]